MKKALSVILMIFFIQSNAQDMKEAYFASGCFWCVESIYESLIGVVKVESGYSGGYTKNPTYYTVLTGKTGHADPTTLNRQGPDRGTHYRSIAFYSNENEKKIINEEIKRLLKNKTYPKIVTEVKKFDVFYIAEDYHQDYKEKNPNNAYIWNVSVPRINKFKSKFSQLLK